MAFRRIPSSPGWPAAGCSPPHFGLALQICDYRQALLLASCARGLNPGVRTGELVTVKALQVGSQFLEFFDSLLIFGNDSQSVPVRHLPIITAGAHILR